MSKALPRLMTIPQIAEETGLALPVVRAIVRRLPKVDSPTRTVLVRRRDVEKALGELRVGPNAPRGGTA